jgi:hypothetical protein
MTRFVSSIFCQALHHLDPTYTNFSHSSHLPIPSNPTISSISPYPSSLFPHQFSHTLTPLSPYPSPNITFSIPLISHIIESTLIITFSQPISTYHFHLFPSPISNYLIHIIHLSISIISKLILDIHI